MSNGKSKLFDLLPALYRLKDAQIAQSQNLSQGPLQSLVMLIEEQLAVVAEDLDQLYDDQFIETCAPWVIPYIGDLIGYESIHGVAPSVASPRSEVANTIALRRRKGTVGVLDEIARDVTGWGAKAREFFKLLATTQYMNHIRPENYYAPDLRRWQPRAYMNTGFDETAHKADVRRVAVERGKYNIPNIGIFLWSLNPYSLTMSPAVAVAGAPGCFRFDPLGRDVPLFDQNVRDVLLRRILCADPSNSVQVSIDGALVPPSKIQVCNLSGPDGNWINLPKSGSPFSASVDPELGRLALPSPATTVEATFYCGFNADIGGGEYPRADSFSASPEQRVIRVPSDFTSIGAALTALHGDGVVEITDSGRYQESSITVAVNNNGHIELRAADGCRPTLILSGEMSVTGGAESVFFMNGLLITGAPVHAPAVGSKLSQLELTHCTLAPGSASPALLATAPGLEVVINKSIVGALTVDPLTVANISDSILDATDPTVTAYAGEQNQAGGALTLQGCTIIGKIHATLLDLVSNSIVWAALSASDSFKAPLWTDRQQQGCVRFSFIPQNSIVPRVFHVEQFAEPLYYSLRYGDPGYAKLFPATDDKIRRGADDGGEMGAFHFLLAPLRETDLRVRLREFMPAGLEFGIFYQN